MELARAWIPGANFSWLGKGWVNADGSERYWMRRFWHHGEKTRLLEGTWFEAV